MGSVASPSFVQLRGGAAGMRAVVLLALAAGFPGFAMADPAAIARCRQESDSLLRLRCYDEIPLPPTGAAVTRPPGPAVETPRAPSATAPAAAPAPTAPASATAAAVPATPADPVARFGLENKPQAAAAPEAIAAIESYIPGRVDGWVRNTRFRLANGQVWEIRENAPASYDLRDPKVRIVRGFSGSFFMEIAGVSQTPRVRRVE